jgi:hypothetical protein
VIARLPDHGVAHQRRGGRQVAGDRGEVERRDGVDEALERPVVDRFQTPGELIGCSARICRGRSATLKRQKSISSQAASISAW